MNTTPPIVLFGKIDIEKLEDILTKYNYCKISDEIGICNHSSSEHFQSYFNTTPRLFAELSLIIQIPKYQTLVSPDYQPEESVNTLLVFKGINKALGEDIETLTSMLDSDSTIHAKLSELVNAHLSTFDNKGRQGFLQVLTLRIWACQLMYDILDEIRYRLHPNNLGKYKQDDITKIRELAKKLKDNFQLYSPSLNEMAEQVKMSPTKFKNIFKDVLNDSPHQFILDLRLNHAKVLLKKQDLTIAEIAYKVGFNHPSALTRLFRNKLGISPNEISKR